jgi:hypothetical protein
VADGIVLSESDRALLQSVLDRVRRDLPPKTAHAPPDDSLTTPEVYAALTPPSGIPALAGALPGSAECAVYRVVGGALEPAGFSRDVLNLSDADVAGSAYALVTRDKFGTWWVGQGVGSASGSGSGSGVGRGTTVSVVSNVCALTGSPGGTRVEYTPITLPPGATVGKATCVDNPGDCCTGTGTGTGTGGTGATLVPCCGTTPVPNTLHATFHDLSNCPCFDGFTLQLTYSANANGSGFAGWWGSASVPGCAGKTMYGYLYCLSNLWHMASWCDHYEAGFVPGERCTAVAATCSPFSATFDNCGPLGGSQMHCCPDVGIATYKWKVTVTA